MIHLGGEIEPSLNLDFNVYPSRWKIHILAILMFLYSMKFLVAGVSSLYKRIHAGVCREWGTCVRN